MEVASLTAFRYNPELFYKWLHPLAVHMISAQPNPAHIALTKLQDTGYISTIITQNIDGLHTRAGAKNVLEIHGTLNTLTCIKCFTQVSSKGVIQEYIRDCTIPHCLVCGGILKPDVILYEEQLPVKTWVKAEEASRNCDLMVIAGTSLEVMPSAKLPIYALDNGAHVIIVNNAETYIDVRADVIIRADVADIFPLISEGVLNA
jgi:NAD-dependent deacetylase